MRVCSKIGHSSEPRPLGSGVFQGLPLPNGRGSDEKHLLWNRLLLNTPQGALRRPWRGNTHRMALVESRDDQRRVLTAEADVIAQHMPAYLLARLIGDIIEVAVRIGGLIIDRRRQRLVADHHETNSQLNCTPRRCG